MPPEPRALIVGAGPAGMRAALDLADLGVRVALIERRSTPGGTLSHLDAQYPTIDCGACQMHDSLSGPPWSDRRCLRTGLDHPLIEVLTSTTLAAAEPNDAGFEVTLSRSDEASDEPQNDGDGDGEADEAAVKPSEDSGTQRQFGAVILAAGFTGFDPALQPQWAYGRHPDVVTGLELERMIKPSPHGGTTPLLRPSTGQPAERVAFVQCVGSRDTERPYCSTVCCMQALKEAILLRERVGVPECHIFAIDARCVGKGYEATLQRALDAGVRLVYARPGAVEPTPRPLLHVEDAAGRRREPFDVVVLSTGLVPPPGTPELAAMLDIELNEHGFVRTEPLKAVTTSRPGVFVAGALSGPSDIPWSVTMASAAALAAAEHLGLPSGSTPAMSEGSEPRPHSAEANLVCPPPRSKGQAPADEQSNLVSSSKRQDSRKIPLKVFGRGGLPPLTPTPIYPKTLVLGAGPAGLTAALAVARAGFAVAVVEREERAGGNLRRLRTVLDGPAPGELLAELLGEVAAEPSIELLCGTELVSHRGGPGDYLAVVRDRRSGAERKIRHGALILATGATELEPAGRFGYGDIPAVITQLELEERLSSGDPLPQENPTVVMIGCVGSRERSRPVCSRVCCTEAVKNALTLAERAPGARVLLLHRDLRTVGLAETWAERARERGLIPIRVPDGEPPRVEAGDAGAIVRFRDPLLGRTVRVDADLVVLSAALIPNLSRGEIAALGLRESPGGFVTEANVKFRPVEASRRGVLVAGTALAPVNLTEAVTQARAAAQRAVALLSREQVVPRPGAAAYRPKWCASCGLCIEVCPAGARELDPDRGATIHPGLCQGCGACAAACPSGCTEQADLSTPSVLSMIEL